MRVNNSPALSTMPQLKPITRKKALELDIAEKFLPHFNRVHQSSFRIDYQLLLSRSDNDIPDITLFDLANPANIVPIEIKKAPDMQKTEVHNSRVSEFMGELYRATKNVREKFGVYLSFGIESDGVTNKSNWKNDLAIIDEHLEKLIYDSVISKTRINMQDLGCVLITDVTIEDNGPPSIAISGFGPPGNLDILQKIENLMKSQPYTDKDTVLVIHCDETVSKYYSGEIDRYFEGCYPNFREVWIIETVIGGRGLLFRRPIKALRN